MVPVKSAFQPASFLVAALSGRQTCQPIYYTSLMTLHLAGHKLNDSLTTSKAQCYAKEKTSLFSVGNALMQYAGECVL